ncbi:MAG: hypothetical protein ABGW92_06400, partial [Methanocaldococcus sp.]
IIVLFILSLILTISICGCFENEKEEVNKPNITVIEKGDIKVQNNKSIESLREKSYKLNNPNDGNKTESMANNITKKPTKRYDFSKQVDMEEMFLNLPYNKEMYLDNKIIKKYKNITFVVSRKPEDFSNAYLYNEVKKYPQRDIYGNYYYYEFIPKNANISISYCYYRKIGNYYIILQTYEKSKRVSDLWVNWTKHIFSLFEK